ncbi:MAG: response regulator transcription factor [Dehalococcoidia bacterium]|nr:response regulator transcription factor [Dehalococcoidia bacterium]
MDASRLPEPADSRDPEQGSDPPLTGRPEFVALVFHLHPYNPAGLIGAMLNQRIAATDRPFDENAVQLVTSLAPALIVLVAELPGDRLTEAVHELRQASDACILLLVSGDDPADLARALNAGADAFLRESEDPAVLNAVLAAIARRSGQGFASYPRGLETAGFRILEERREAWFGDQLIPLTGMEFRVFATLAANPGRVISPAGILAAAGIEAPEESAAAQVKVYILRIRRKIHDVAPGREYIHNVRGMGYMFERREHATLPGASSHR